MSTIKAKAFQHPSATSNNITFNADGTHTVNAVYPTTSKNLLINGGMNVWQRSTSATGKTSGGYHSVDRIRNSLNSMGTWTHAQSTDVPSGQGFGYSLKIDCTTADASPAAGDYNSILQNIEGQNIQHIAHGTSNAKQLTFSCWVKSNKTGVYTVEFYKYGTSTQRQIAKEITINNANTWEKKTVTIPGDTTEGVNNNNGLAFEAQIWLGAGTTFTSGTFNDSAWATATNANRVSPNQVNLADSTSNEFLTTGWQLEVGDQATGFEFEPVDKIEQKCFRYYYNTRQISGSTYPGASFAHGISGTRYASGTTFPVTMRAFPSVTIRRPSDNVAGDAHKYLGVDGTTTAADTDLGTVSVIDRGRTGFPYFTVTVGGNTGGGLLFHYEADAEL
jgi:hypothetical protein